MRLFVAVPVPEETRVRIGLRLGHLVDDDRFAWTRRDGWHVTVAFVGEVADPLLEAVVAAVWGAASVLRPGPVTLRTTDPVVLGRGGALAVALDDQPAGHLARLGGAVQAALDAADLPVTPRPVRPHLTLARARRGRAVPPEVRDAVDVAGIDWTARHIEVVQSVLGEGPARYRSVATLPLPG